MFLEAQCLLTLGERSTANPSTESFTKITSEVFVYAAHQVDQNNAGTIRAREVNVVCAGWPCGALVECGAMLCHAHISNQSSPRKGHLLDSICNV